MCDREKQSDAFRRHATKTLTPAARDEGTADACTLAARLSALPDMRGVRPVVATIGHLTYFGCLYVMGEEGEEGATFLGRRPIKMRGRAGFCLTSPRGDGPEWYVAGYYPSDVPTRWNPSGRTFNLKPWTVSGSVDDYERYRHVRIPFAMTDIILDEADALIRADWLDDRGRPDVAEWLRANAHTF